MITEKPMIATQENLQKIYAVLGLPCNLAGLVAVQIVLRAGEPITIMETRNGIVQQEGEADAGTSNSQA